MSIFLLVLYVLFIFFLIGFVIAGIELLESKCNLDEEARYPVRGIAFFLTLVYSISIALCIFDNINNVWYYFKLPLFIIIFPIITECIGYFIDIYCKKYLIKISNYINYIGESINNIFIKAGKFLKKKEREIRNNDK